MPRRKRTRGRTSTRQISLSLLLFSVSVAVFLSQTVVPSITRRRSGNRHRHRRPKSVRVQQILNMTSTPISTKPKNWFETPVVSMSSPSPVTSISTKFKSQFETPTHSISSSSSMTSVSTKPKNWFAIPTFSVSSPGPMILTTTQIPKGPFPLPSLSRWTDANNSSPEGSVDNNVHAGSSWAASLANGLLAALPAHWMVERLHSAPTRSSDQEREFSYEDSIFSARRKGIWIGCGSDSYLICKGAYRAIKVVDAAKVADVGCIRNSGWLPHVLGKLRGEFRMVHLICIVPEQMHVKEVMELYKDVTMKVSVIVKNVLEEEITEKVDLLIGYGFLKGGTLIRAMRFMRLVKRSGNVRYLLLENYPGEKNVVINELKSNGKNDRKIRINTGIAPFYFPKAIYNYANEDDNDERVEKTIKVVRVDELFEGQMTLRYDQLIDPRKKKLEKLGIQQ